MVHDEPIVPGSGAPKKRPPFTTVGFPKRSDARRLGWVWSLIAHVLILLLLLAPTFVRTVIPEAFSTGAGGEGPAGGGGGGTNGTGGRDMFKNPEALRYIRVVPEPAKAAEPEPEQPVESIPIPPVTPPPTPEPEPVTSKVVEIAALLPEDGPRVVAGSGTGGGTGNDGTAGTGPGTGGGIGSGVGTGTGSGVGPGTGGGNGEIHPPTPIQLFLPPVPAPDGIKPYELVAYFEVDETGKSRLLRFNESKDRAYNRELKQRLEQMRFRPAVRPDGTPVKQVFALTISIY